MKYLIMLILILQTGITTAAMAKDPFTKSKKSMHLSNGITLKYVEAGNPQGSPILLIHGYSDTSRSFQSLIEELLKQDQNLYLLAPDLRGHGGSSMPPIDESDGYTFDKIIGDLLELMERKGVISAHLAGHSMGTFIAQELALKFPDKVRSLTLIAGAADCTRNAAVQDFLIGELTNGWKQALADRYGPAWKRKSYSKTPKDLGVDVTEFLREFWVTEVNTPPSYLNAIFQETIRNPLGTWFGTMAEIDKFNNTGRLKDLNVPTLVLWAEGDELFPKNPDQDILMEALQTARLSNNTPIFSKGYGKAGNNQKPMGHNFHWGIPKEVAQDMIEFISERSVFRPAKISDTEYLGAASYDPDFQKTDKGPKPF
jgi:pimeloyl-ACP methyl ester carboxylesterase